MRSMIAVLLACLACHRHREVVPERLTAGVDGAYRFLIDVPGVYMSGRFVIADTQVFLDTDYECVFADAPKSSDGLRSTWYDCNRTPDGAFLQLRISQVDPVKKSLWYARYRVADTRRRCTVYSIHGECIEGYRARGTRWVDRYGAMIVTRGLAGTPPDSVAQIVPRGSRPLRARCDTTAFSKECEQ